MKTALLLLPLAGLSVAEPQGGLFSGITGAFNNFFGGSQPPPPRQPQGQRQPQRQPQRQQQQFQQQQQQPQQQFQQQQFQQQPQQQFQQQPQQQFQQQQQPQQQFQPQPSFQQPQTQTFTRPQSNQQQPAAPQFNPTSAPAPRAPSGGTGLCAAASPNHFWTDPRDGKQRGYVATWKFGCKTFEQSDALEYCRSMGMYPVSLDSPAKQDNFNRLIAQDAQRYFWTGGVVKHAQEVVEWNNPRGAHIPFSQSSHWSHTGGADLPQPDNRAAGETPPHPEVCLGILNNFYADGIKWHDVACHHKKPTICEPSN